MSARSVCEAAGEPMGTFDECFGTVDQLVMRTTLALTEEPVFPPSEGLLLPGSTSLEVFQELADSHRGYFDEGPERFRAILQLTATAILWRGELLAPLAARNARTRRAVKERLWPLRTQGVLDATVDIGAATSAFVDCVTGVEMCFIIDGDTPARDAGYQEAVRCLAAVLD